MVLLNEVLSKYYVSVFLLPSQSCEVGRAIRINPIKKEKTVAQRGRANR